MNKTSIMAAEAFVNKVRFSSRNTRVEGQVMYLFEKKIAWWERDDVVLTMAGEDTSTTTDRLTMILSYFGTGLSLRRREGISYLMDSEGSEIIPMPLKLKLEYVKYTNFEYERYQGWTLVVDGEDWRRRPC